MSQISELDNAIATEAVAAVTDRRRPGRLDHINPELIPILRGQAASQPIEFEDADECAALRGLGAGVLLSAPVWVGIAYLGSWFLS